MHVRKIVITSNFFKAFLKLARDTQERATKAENLFRANPMHPSLRMHPLKGEWQGFWSISVIMNIRIIFERMEDGDIIFLTIGKHDIYRS